MTIAFVQAKSAGTDGTSANNLPVTISAVGTGNMVAGIAGWGSATTSDLTSITDNAGTGNVYTIVRRIADATNGGCAASFYGYNLTGNPTVLTMNLGASLPFRGISVIEFSGERTASAPLDGTNEQGQLQTAPGTGANGAKSGAGNLTPSAANYLVWGGSIDTGSLGGGGSQFAAGTSFTEPTNAEYSVSGQVSLSSEYWIQTTATAANASFTLTQNTAHITMMMVFAVPGGGAAVDNPRNYQDGVPGAYYTDPGYSALYGYEQQGIPLANRDSQTNTTLTGAFSSAGVATPVGVGASIASAAASSAGVSSVIGVGASFAAADINAIALATVTGVPNIISAATITAAAVATMIGVGQNAGSIVSGDGSIIGTSSMIGVGASTAAGVVTAAGTETTIGVGASTVAGVISETAVGQALGAGASSGGNVIISADGSITASGSVNGTGASIVAADIHASSVATVRGATTNPSHVVHGGHVRHALKRQQLMLDRDERDLLELATMLAPLISQGGALWHR